MKTLKRFFDDIHAIAEALNFGVLDVNVELGKVDRDLIANFRRRRPSVKKTEVE